MSKLNLGLKQKGKLSAKQDPQRKKSRQAVVKRILQHGSTCEGCGDVLERSPEWAHLFGRRNIIREPLASFPELTVGLDRKCHLAIDVQINVELRSRLRWEGLARLGERYPVFKSVISEYQKKNNALDDKASDELAIICARAVEAVFNEKVKDLDNYALYLR